MDDKLYLNRDGLTDYDTLIKKYIRVQINKAITEYEAGDQLEIIEYVPAEDDN